MARAKAPDVGEGEEYVMSAANVLLYSVDDKKQREIVAWRVDVFERRGFASSAAVMMGLRRNVDRQVVEDLLDAGCSHELVAEIVL